MSCPAEISAYTSCVSRYNVETLSPVLSSKCSTAAWSAGAAPTWDPTCSCSVVASMSNVICAPPASAVAAGGWCSTEIAQGATALYQSYYAREQSQCSALHVSGLHWAAGSLTAGPAAAVAATTTSSSWGAASTSKNGTTSGVAHGTGAGGRPAATTSAASHGNPAGPKASTSAAAAAGPSARALLLPMAAVAFASWVLSAA